MKIPYEGQNSRMCQKKILKMAEKNHYETPKTLPTLTQLQSSTTSSPRFMSNWVHVKIQLVKLETGNKRRKLIWHNSKIRTVPHFSLVVSPHYLSHASSFGPHAKIYVKIYYDSLGFEV